MAERTGSHIQRGDDGYDVRRFRPDDVSGFLALDQAVWNRDRSRDWFEWKYVDNPYAAAVPIFVAERGDEIVGARPFMVFRLRAGDETRLAYQPSDTMVHPDHRRRGLFTRMTERAIEHYADGPPSLFFNFPNSQSLPGYRKLGWRPVGNRATYYRVQNPASLLSERTNDIRMRLLGRVGTSVARCYCHARSRLSGRVANVTVERRPGADPTLLSDLYRRRVPDRIHAVRDEQFYRWRLASPAWKRATYVARRGGEPVAAVVARSRTTNEGVNVTQLAEVVPLVGDEQWTDALDRLFRRIADDYGGSDLIAIADSTVPHDLLASLGFYRDDIVPLSWITNRCTLAARPLGDDPSWLVGDRRLVDRSDWVMTFLERDTT